MKHKNSESEGGGNGGGFYETDSYDEDDDDDYYSGSEDIIEIRIASNMDNKNCNIIDTNE